MTLSIFGSCASVCLILSAAPNSSVPTSDHDIEQPVPTSVPTSDHDIEQPGEPIVDDDESIETATPDPTPPAVNPGDSDGPGDPVVAEQAGVGGPIPFGAAAVLEVGGNGTFAATADFWYLRARPFVGWFVADGIQLTFGNDIIFGQNTGEPLRIAFTAMLEPSAHFPVRKRVWIALGVGVGVSYARVEQRAKVGGVLTPRLGMDMLVGRSGMFHLSPIVTLTTSEVVNPTSRTLGSGNRIAGGVEIGYGALF